MQFRCEDGRFAVILFHENYEGGGERLARVGLGEGFVTERKWEIEDSNGSTIHVHSHAPSVGDGALIHVLIIIDALERVAEVLCDAREGRDGGGGGVTPIVVVQVELLPTGVRRLRLVPHPARSVRSKDVFDRQLKGGVIGGGNGSRSEREGSIGREEDETVSFFPAVRVV